MRAIDGDALEELFREVIGGIAKKPEMNGNLEHMVRASAMVIKMIQDAPTIEPEPHWIPCKERMPEEYGNYLATMDDGDVQECTYSPEKNTPFMRGGWSTCEADGIVFLDIAEVTAWQPLPEPYREEGD